LLDDEIVAPSSSRRRWDASPVGARDGRNESRPRFVLIGSDETRRSRLRPQILDRFGLRVSVRDLTDKAERLEVYKRVRDYAQHASASS